MKLTASTLALSFVLVSTAAFAHGERPRSAHGGEVQDAQGVWVELVVRGTDITVYVLSEHGEPVSAEQVTGTATVLIEGKTHRVELTPGEANSLHGTLSTAAAGKIVATVSLKVAGKPASARFTGSA